LSSLIFSRPSKLESYVNSSKSHLKILGLLFGSHTQSDVPILTRQMTKDRVLRSVVGCQMSNHWLGAENTELCSLVK